MSTRLVAVQQLVDASSSHCAYLVSCVRTGAAALVDPCASLEGPIRGAIAQRGLRVRFVLETHCPTPQEPARSASPYDSLLTRLGLSREEGKHPDTTDLSWSGVPRVGPLPGDVTRRALLLEAAGTTLGVHPLPPAARVGERYTIGGSRCTAFDGRICQRVRVALGAFHIEVLCIPELEGRAVYRVGERLFTGCRLNSGGPERGSESTPDPLLDLPPDVLVHPGVVTAGLRVSTIAQERWWREQRLAVALPVGGPWSSVGRGV